MKQGYYNQEGNFVETPRVVNAFVPLTKQANKSRWIHEKCGQPMGLFPISSDLPAEYWECKGCNVKITVEQRNRTFAEIIEYVKELYGLKLLQYSRENHYFQMVSARFIGDDRISARRYEIKTTESREIRDRILDELQSRLGILIDKISEYFNEG